ncbi:hypothetical protein RND71_003545 [Anisodus tanguticus]|uniref:Uncharacterized protein n=1 Tax=Anisodus tanguticus TaxID=243964 RepID=A0AAE1SUS6_9SOLA|nr:hypothetical protein RND71_003545 [Anisodus tanguticus]
MDSFPTFSLSTLSDSAQQMLSVLDILDNVDLLHWTLPIDKSPTTSQVVSPQIIFKSTEPNNVRSGVRLSQQVNKDRHCRKRYPLKLTKPDGLANGIHSNNIQVNRARRCQKCHPLKRSHLEGCDKQSRASMKNINNQHAGLGTWKWVKAITGEKRKDQI